MMKNSPLKYLIPFLLYCIDWTFAQNFANCDFYKELTPNVVYSFTSPNYNNPYAPGTFCRYTAQAPAGNQIILRCTDVNLPYSDRCAGDRLQVSRAGNTNLADSERYCTGPFTTKSFSERIVVALFSPPQSRGGTYRCELYATKGCECGRKNQARIVNGVETGINEYPSMAAIVTKQDGQVQCGATIIDQYYALTAAHCVNSPGKFAEQLELLVGEHDYRNPSETPYTQKYAIASAVRHPSYSSEKDINDIALITLAKPIAFNNGVGPICLPFKYQSASFEGRSVVALGWGTIEYGGPVSSRLQKVALDVTSQLKCEAAYPNRITSGQFCTYTRNKDTCSYDSGGPLLFSDVTGNNLLYQIGITSFGVNCASSMPSVSTRVAAYLDWITSEARYARFCVQ
ncbi:venom serine protease-like [Sitodiplosis mosellana]|uniref:venom serine protease-like n=1 Tax=Sitodiplosis mosellana TaxID=263140 RepID=UPI0024450C31|nr:venom serine protease-like [Sitodiplosis mosellana]